MLCRLGLFLSTVASITSSLVADHMVTVYLCDKAREAMLVSYISEPVLAFGAMKQWNEQGLCPLFMSFRAALLRGVVNEGTLGEISAMILMLKSMDVLNAGLSWKSVRVFLKQLAEVNKDIKKQIRAMYPKKSKLNFNHFIQWFGKFKHSDICLLLRRRAACIFPRNQDGADLLIPFFVRNGEETKFEAILVQVKNGLKANDTKEVGRKLFASYVFKHWKEKEQNFPFIRLVLELGLSRVNQKLISIPMKNNADVVEVLVKRDQSTPAKGKAAFIVTSSISGHKSLLPFTRRSHFL